MMLSLIVACSRNGVIGVDNRLPWRLPEDLKHFKRVTMGKPLIMGRKTYDSIGRPLPGRTTVVVTRQPGWRAEGVIVCSSLEDAIGRAQGALGPGDDEVIVAGGEQIYRQCLDRADRIYLTRVEIDVEGDARFPALDMACWRSIEETGGYSEGAGLYFYFVTYEKVKGECGD